MKQWRADIEEYWRQASADRRLLLWLALMTYFCSGLFLCLFTQGVDFHLMYYAAKNIAEGHGASIYDRFLAFKPGENSLFYMYPPAAAAFYLPLSFFSPVQGLMIFHLISHAALWSVLWVWLTRLSRDKDTGALLFILTLLFFPLYYGLHMGQSEWLVLAFLVFATEAEKRERWAVAAFLFSLAISLKMFLAFFLLHWLLVGRKQLLGWCALFLVLECAVGALLVTLPVFSSWVLRLASPIGIEAFIDNQSLTGFLYRSLTANHFTTGFIDSLALAKTLRNILSFGLVLVYGMTVWRARRRSPALLFGFALTTALLVSPHTDTHHLALLLIPFSAFLLEGKRTSALYGFYAFFACYIPLIAFPFLWSERANTVASQVSHVVLSLPFFVLLGFWLYQRRVLVRLR